MKRVLEALDENIIKAKCVIGTKKEAVDQIIIMFIIIAVAAGIAGLLYIFGTGTLLPNFQNKMNTLVSNWFDHK